MTATAIFDSMLMRTMASACIIVAVTVAAGQWLATARPGPVDRIVVASQVRPVKQSIEGIRSVLDPSSTGSVGRGRTVTLDPCTGEIRR